MNIEEGSRRLSVVMTLFAVICVWIPGVIVSIKLANSTGEGGYVAAGLIFTLITGFVVKDICHKIGMWVIKGFDDGVEVK